MKILIIGGTGYLGSHLSRCFSLVGHEVLILVRPSSNLMKLKSCGESIKIVSYNELSEIDGYIKGAGIDCIINTACNYGRNNESMSNIITSNFTFPMAVLESAIINGVETFINTDTTLDKYINPYALSKTHFSEWGRMEALNDKIQFINIKLEHIYGEQDATSKFISYVINSCLNNMPELQLTEGNQKRDFVYISDVVSAYEIILNKRKELSRFENIALGSGTTISIKELVTNIHRLAQSKTRLIFGAIPYRSNEQMYSCADINQLLSLGWAPQYSLDAGLKKVIELEKKT